MKRVIARLGALPALVLLLALMNSPVGAAWQWLYPTPQGHTLNDVAFLTTTTAIAVGDAGTIMVSHDAGVSWSVVNKVNGIRSPLRKIATVDASVAFVVGDGGVILKTTDSGFTWVAKPSGTTANLSDIDFSGTTGVAIASPAMIRTADGGESWVPVPLQMGTPVSVDVVSPTLVYLADYGSLLRSNDGGATWAFLFMSSGGMSRISFANELEAVFTAWDHMEITHDGGITWEWRYLGPGQSETALNPSDLVFVAPGTVVFSAGATICDVYNPYRCSTYGEAQATTDGGISWAIEQTNHRLNGVAVNSEGVRLFVGNAGVIQRWLPPAEILQVAGSEDESLPGGAMTFAGDETGITVGTLEGHFWDGYEYSEFLHTSDAGANWDRSYLVGALIRDVAFSPSSGSTPPAYAAGFDTRTNSALISKSTDGGANWTTLWSDAAFPMLRALRFTTATHAVAVGDNGTIVTIEDNVATPSTQAPGTSLRAVAFATLSDGVAVGLSGPAGARNAVILRTEDGGDSWEPISTSASDWLYGADFATSQVGVAVGSRGAVLRTSNGGRSWDVIASPTATDLHAVKFLDATHGFICGAGGTVLETSNAGADWIPLATPTTYSLADIEPFGTSGALFGGPGFNVLKYFQAPVPTLISQFGGKSSDFGVDLSWSVHDAFDLDHFRIARHNVEGPAGGVQHDLTADRRSFRDEQVTAGSTYEYQLFAVDRSGEEFASAPVRVTIPTADVALLPNIPNPFNPSTTLRFVVPARERVTLAIYDVAGRHVATLVDAVRAAGMNTVDWNGTDRSGNPVASGVYVSRLRVGTKSVSRTMVLLK